MPKLPLINLYSYACVDSNQQPVWWVTYYNHRAAITQVSLNQVIADVPAPPRSQPIREFGLRVWITKDASGEWIRMAGK